MARHKTFGMCYDAASCRLNLAEWSLPSDFNIDSSALLHFCIHFSHRLHVDDLSSAHVYIRMPEGYTIGTIPTPVLVDCAQLVKANSIEGSKKSSVKVVYTPWENLYKRSEMDIGQIGFHSTTGGSLRYITVDKKANDIVNRLNKTKKEKSTSWIRETKEEYERFQRQILRKVRKDYQTREKESKEANLKQKEESLEDLFASVPSSKFQSNQDMDVTAEEYENDFM